MGNDGSIFVGGKVGAGVPPLDKLEQLGTRAGNSTQEGGESGRGSETLGALRKRARAKFYSQRLAVRLANLDSPLKKSYWDSSRCAGVL